MKYEYKLGKSKSWSESAVVGIIAGSMCANNGDDTVYIHADGHTTWNSKE